MDDIIQFGSSKSLVDDFKSSMMRKFEMTDLGMWRYFLGLDVTQEENGIFICQKKYAADLLKRFSMTNYKVAATPVSINEKFQHEDGTERADPRLFRRLAGGLNYLTHIRPNISFSISVV